MCYWVYVQFIKFLKSNLHGVFHMKLVTILIPAKFEWHEYFANYVIVKSKERKKVCLLQALV